jgi:hypothetical protein
VCASAIGDVKPFEISDQPRLGRIDTHQPCRSVANVRTKRPISDIGFRRGMGMRAKNFEAIPASFFDLSSQRSKVNRKGLVKILGTR